MLIFQQTLYQKSPAYELDSEVRRFVWKGPQVSVRAENNAQVQMRVPEIYANIRDDGPDTQRGRDLLRNIKMAEKNDGMAIPDRTQHGKKNTQQDVQRIVIDTNIPSFGNMVATRAAGFLHVGDFKAAYDYVVECQNSIALIQTQLQKQANPMLGDRAFEVLRRDFEQAEKDLSVLSQACYVMLSTYHPNFKKMPNPAEQFDALPRQPLATLFGEESYEAIRKYLNEEELVRNVIPPAYSQKAGEQLKQEFVTAENGLRHMRSDLLQIKEADSRELGELAKKWELFGNSRFGIYHGMLEQYQTAIESYRAAALADIHEQGNYSRQLSEDPAYSKLPQKQRNELEQVYLQWGGRAIEQLQQRQQLLAVLADRAAHNLFFESAERPSLHIEALSGSAGKFGISQTLALLLPAIQSDGETQGAEPPVWKQNAMVLRNLLDVERFQASFAGKLDVASRVDGLAKEALQQETGSGDQIYFDTVRLREAFTQELGMQYASVARQMKTEQYLQNIQSTGDPAEVLSGIRGIGEQYGKQTLMWAALGLSLFSKSPSGRRMAGGLMNGLIAWDVIDGDYVGAATLFVGKYGASRIPLLGKSLPHGQLMQGLANTKMLYDGATGAAQAIHNIQYGFKAPDAIDLSTAVMSGLLLPAYQGHLQLRQIKDVYKTTLRTAREAGFVPGAMTINYDAFRGELNLGGANILRLTKEGVYLLSGYEHNAPQVLRPTPDGGMRNVPWVKVGTFRDANHISFMVRKGDLIRTPQSEGMPTREFRIVDNGVVELGRANGEPMNEAAQNRTKEAGQNARAQSARQEEGQSWRKETEQNKRQTDTPKQKAAELKQIDPYAELGVGRDATVTVLKEKRKSWLRKNPNALSGENHPSELVLKAINQEISVREGKYTQKKKK